MNLPVGMTASFFFFFCTEDTEAQRANGALRGQVTSLSRVLCGSGVFQIPKPGLFSPKMLLYTDKAKWKKEGSWKSNNNL